MASQQDKAAKATSTVGSKASPAGKKHGRTSAKREGSVGSIAASCTSAHDDVPVPDELTCGICRDVLDGAVQTPCCGGLSCRECIEAVVAATNQCPYCRDAIGAPSDVLRDVRAERAAAALVRPCKYAGCDYRGKRDELKAHAVKCNKRPKDEVIAELRECDAEWRRQRCWQLSSIILRFANMPSNNAYDEAQNLCEMLMCRLHVVLYVGGQRREYRESAAQHPCAPEMKLLPRTHAEYVAPVIKLSHIEDQVLPTACYVMPCWNPGATRRIVIPAKSSESVLAKGVQPLPGSKSV